MKVQKFGGTSVGSPKRIKDVASLITQPVSQNSTSGKENGKNIIVLSAMSGTTNALLEISSAIEAGNIGHAKELIAHLYGKYKEVVDELLSSDKAKKKAMEIVDSIFNDIKSFLKKEYSVKTEKEIVAKGELLSTNLMHQYLLEQDIDAALIPALDYMMIDEFGDPDFEYIKENLSKKLEDTKDVNLIITQGFICRNPKGEVDNLLRGGSDYTASIIGAAVNADEVDIWTDIDGMHNNDPRFVEETSPVHNLHFEEAAELAYFGAKILHPTCILPAKLNNIPVRLLNTMEPQAEGTLINNELEHGTIKAVAAKDNITAIKIKSSRMLLAYGFLKKVFEVFEKYRTPIDMIATSEVGVSLTIDDNTHLQEILNDLEELGTVSIDKNMVIICVVGDLEWQNKGFEARALDALRNIPVRMISYGGSNYNISFLIDKANKTKALRLLSYHLF